MCFDWDFILEELEEMVLRWDNDNRRTYSEAFLLMGGASIHSEINYNTSVLVH